MNIKSKIEKVLTSRAVFPILDKISLKLDQLLANLKMRSKRTPRKAESAPVGESP